MRARLLLLLAIVVLVAACADATPYAATVNGENVDRSYLDEELRALMANEAYRAQVAQSQGEDPNEPSGFSEAKVPTDLASFWTTQLVYQTVVDQALDEMGIEISSADLEAARQSLLSESAGSGTDFEAFPVWFQNRLVQRTASISLLSAALAPSPPTESDLEAYFEQNEARYLAECPSERVVSHILLATEEEAREVVAELLSGADFAETAAAVSIDPTAAASGGALGCVDQPFVDEFAVAAVAATPGELTGPVETEFGFHVILVEEAPITFESMRARMQSDLAAEVGDPLLGFFEERFAEADVTVDPRYGEWVSNGAASEVLPPTPPAVREGREPSEAPELGAVIGG